MNYRLAQEAVFPGAIEDVKAAIRFLRVNAAEYGYDPDKIAVWSESASGYPPDREFEKAWLDRYIRDMTEEELDQASTCWNR